MGHVDYGHPACKLSICDSSTWLAVQEGNRKVEKIWEREQLWCFYSSQSVDSAVYVSGKTEWCVPSTRLKWW